MFTIPEKANRCRTLRPVSILPTCRQTGPARFVLRQRTSSKKWRNCWWLLWSPVNLFLEVHSVGAFDVDRRIFDELIPLPEGTSYNAYLIKGSGKTALIDTVDPSKEYDLISNLVKLGVERIDYVVINHAEQDHSGSLPMILEFYPEAQVVTNAKVPGSPCCPAACPSGTL